jgi:hypothetical protein
MSVSNNFKNNDKVLAIWPGYTDRKFGSYWWRGTLIKRNGVNQFIISFDGQECAVSEQFVKADGVVHAATEEETRLFCLLHGRIPGDKLTSGIISKNPRGVKLIKPILVM